MAIHPTAVVDSTAEIDSTVEIGPYAVIGADVKIGANTKVDAHATVSGPSTIGEGNYIGSFTVVGGDPQDKTYKGESTELIVGDNNKIREFTSIHRGTAKGGSKTIIGSDNLLMASTHVAHDCIIGNHTILANVATLAGHVEIDDHACVGGLVAVHQFCRIGAFAYIGGVSGITLDVPPYVLIAGIRNRTRVSGINKVGLRRSGLSRETINKLDSAFKLIFRSPNLLLKDALEMAKDELGDCAEVMNMVEFFESSKRGVIRQTNEE